jgi:transposase-like protein
MDQEKRPRRQHSPEDKVRILRLHLVERKAISEICEAEGIHPTLFYQWQKTFFEKGTAAFEGGRSPSRVVGQNERKIEALESKLRRKDEVIAEIMEDLVRTKKENGES